jgi:hypothetical protein
MMPQGFHSRQAQTQAQARDKTVGSEATLREIDVSIRDIVANAFDQARAILTRRRADLDKGTELLLTNEVITAEDFPAIARTKPGGKTMAARAWARQSVAGRPWQKPPPGLAPHSDRGSQYAAADYRKVLGAAYSAALI